MIETKAKKCNGNGKAIGYGCGKLTKHRKYGLGKSCCYASWLYSSENGKIEMNKALNKVSKPRKELDSLKKETKNRQGLTTLIKSVAKVCHEYIRLRDVNKPCISCGTQYKNDFDAGHFYSAGKFSNLKFNEFNINGQCIQCNRFNEGNEANYRINLPERIGLNALDELDFLAAEYKKQSSFKWDKEDLKEIKSYYKNKIKKLK